MDDLGIAIEGVLLVKLGLTGVALATERHVHVSATNHGRATLRCGSKRKAGVLLAQLADGRQFLDLLAFGDQSQYVLEATAQEGSLKGSDDHDFLLIGSHLSELDNVSEELTLVDTDDIKLAPGVPEVVDKAGRWDGLFFDAVVRRNRLSVVSVVCTELDLQYFFACDFVFAASTQQLSAFAREHAAHNQLNTPALLQAVERRQVLAVRDLGAGHEFFVWLLRGIRTTFKHFCLILNNPANGRHANHRGYQSSLLIG